MIEEGLLQEFLIHERPPGTGLLRLDFRVERQGLSMTLDGAQNIMHFSKANHENLMHVPRPQRH